MTDRRTETAQSDDEELRSLLKGEIGLPYWLETPEEDPPKDRCVERGIITAVLAVACAAVILFLAFAATAQSRDLTGGEMLQHYNAGGTSQDTVSMYVMGVVDGMGMSGTICVPQDKPKGDYVRQVVYNLGANEQLHERRFDVAVSSAAIMAYPCGDPA